ncbi:diaminopimelate decarboxylase [Marinivivus vitaminiproducens]|nr:diaminopimelate decarboxylase [Geminicoccaceae bacterium SCSIO 64248]
MDAFTYRNGALHAEDVPLARIVELAGTPTYVYSATAMTARLKALQAAFAGQRVRFFYAMKANDHLAVLRTLSNAGAGVEIVSGGELARALAAGVAPGDILFAGVGKTRDELAEALAAGIAQFNVESVPELRALNEVALGQGRQAPVALRINPDVAARTHAKISTGSYGDKFGIAHDEAADALALAWSLPGIRVAGLHLHIGSQITDAGPLTEAYARLVDLARLFAEKGRRLERLDFGGGFGVRYQKGQASIDLAALAAQVRRLTEGLDVEIAFEPGRFLVAEAGALLARVVYVKENAGRRFAILDAGMNDLVRPAMYDARHEIVPLREPDASDAHGRVDVVGPVCESADIFGRDRILAGVQAGDAVALTGAGAYGAVMTSTYNARPKAAEVMVRGDACTVIRPRQEREAMWADERLPEWLDAR